MMCDDTHWPVLILAELDVGMIYTCHAPLCRRSTRDQLHELLVGRIYRSDDLVLPGTHVYIVRH